MKRIALFLLAVLIFSGCQKEMAEIPTQISSQEAQESSSEEMQEVNYEKLRIQGQFAKHMKEFPGEVDSLYTPNGFVFINDKEFITKVWNLLSIDKWIETDDNLKYRNIPDTEHGNPPYLVLQFFNGNNI